MKRNYLAVTVLTVLVAMALVTAGAIVASGSVGAQDTADTDSTNSQSIKVSATGSAEDEPNQAVISVAARAAGDNISSVRDDLATGSAELTDALDELDVEYETTQYDIRQPYDARDERDQPAYEGIHAYEVTIDDPDDVGTVIDAAAGAGAEVGNVQLTLSDRRRTNLRDDAIEAAMNDARRQADTIAEAGDLSVTGVSTVDASQQRFSPVSFETARSFAADQEGGAPPTEIQTGEVSVTYSVTVTYNATG
jgi:uncharacterized protein YggE